MPYVGNRSRPRLNCSIDGEAEIWLEPQEGPLRQAPHSSEESFPAGPVTEVGS